MLIFIEIKINALSSEVVMMLMEKLDRKRPGQDWRDVGRKLGIRASDLYSVEQEERRGESPTRCIFGILSSSKKVVSLRTFIVAIHKLGRHDICNATYEAFSEFIT